MEKIDARLIPERFRELDAFAIQLPKDICAPIKIDELPEFDLVTLERDGDQYRITAGEHLASRLMSYLTFIRKRDTPWLERKREMLERHL
jgi:hypothetical protein